MNEIWEIIKPVLDFWVLVSIVVTLSIVQMFKAILKQLDKQYMCSNVDPFWIKSIIFSFACFVGYQVTLFFMEGAPMVDKWAAAIAILNTGIYKGFLIYATKKKWLGVISALKMRKLVVRDGRERIVNSKDETEIVGRRLDDET